MFQQHDKKFQKLEFFNEVFKQIFDVEMHLVRLNRHKYLFRLKNLSSLCYFSFVSSNCWIGFQFRGQIVIY